MASSSCLFTGTEGKHNPFQDNDARGPKGAYEIRETRGGLYVRIDLPGVPKENVKVIPNASRMTFNIIANAPAKKDFFRHDFERVYMAYIIVDQDPTKIDVDQQFSNGSLKLFFPRTIGTLEFFPRKQPLAFDEKQGLFGQDSRIELHQPEIMIGSKAYSFHPNLTCTFCDGGKDCNHLVPVSLTEEECCINPFVVSGVAGLFEKRFYSTALGWVVYLRFDLPGMPKFHGEAERSFWAIRSKMNLKDYYLDDGPRQYNCGLILTCDCCVFDPIEVDFCDGVVRVLLHISRKDTTDQSIYEKKKFALSGQH